MLLVNVDRPRAVVSVWGSMIFPSHSRDTAPYTSILIGLYGVRNLVPRGRFSSWDRSRSVISGESRAMKRTEAIDQLREIQEISDLKVAHRLADDILCRLLQSLGYEDVVAEYRAQAEPAV